MSGLLAGLLLIGMGLLRMGKLIEFIPFQKQDGEIVVGVGITGLNTAPVHLFSQSGIAKLICIEISERKEALGLSQPRPLFKNRLCL